MATAAAPRTPRRRGRARTNPAVSVKERLDGLWQDGRWWCNCKPRKEAALREVKKATPNKGRFFWTCPARPFCHFFLWRDQASLRETPRPQSAVVDAGTAAADDEELPPPPKTPAFTQRLLTSYGVQVTPGRCLAEGGSGDDDDGDDDDGDDGQASGGARTPKTAAAAAPTAAPKGDESPTTPSRLPSSKRNRDDLHQQQHDNDDDDDDDEFSDLSSDEERQLAKLADKSAEASRRHPVNALATPASDRKTDTAIPAPIARTLFPRSDAKRPKTDIFHQAPPAGLLTPAITPSAGRPACPATPSSSPSDACYDVADEAMALFQDQPIESSVRRSLHQLLVTADRRTSGVVLARDYARAALKVKDDEIAALRQRVAALEKQERLHHSQLTHIKAQLIKMYEDH